MAKVYEENITAKRRADRIAALPADVQAKLEEYSKSRTMTDELLPIKRKRPKLEIGDVFVVQPKEGLYFYGRVLNVDVARKDKWWHDALVVCIYRNKTDRLTLDDFAPSYDDLLVGPDIIVKGAFHSGYLYKVGHVDLSEEERALDYGFFDTCRHTIKDEYDNPMGHEPKLLNALAIGSFGGLAYDMRCEFIIDPGLLEGVAAGGAAGAADADAAAGADGGGTEPEFEEEPADPEEEAMMQRQYSIRINARLMPFNRDELFGDVFEKALEELGLASWTGAGTSTSEGEPQWSDVHFELSDNEPGTRERFLSIFRQCPYMPKGSAVVCPDGSELAVGVFEGLALYLDAGVLSEGSRGEGAGGEGSNEGSGGIDALAAQADALIQGAGSRFSHWACESYTAIYYYGASFAAMRDALSPLVGTHPLCRNSRMEQIA